ncbi:MAG: Gfo/Idh/MocA family oxidoreductase [Gammaproteobacteria bacterium]
MPRTTPPASSRAAPNLRAAVIGVGYLGNFHAQKYVACPGVDLVAVVDTDAARAAEIAAKYGARALTDYHDVLDAVDLVSIVVPPAYHFDIAFDCLAAGVHTLVEKPVTERVDQAEALIDCATRAALVLQVGHLERFNPVVLALRKHIDRPRLIEAQRFAAYKARGTEVDVVLDLMIHDIDIVLSIAASPVTAIHSTGTAVVTSDIDIAHARIEFADGLVAELAASRVSQEPTRTMKVVEESRCIVIDYTNHELRFGTLEDGHEHLEQAEVTFESEARTVAGTDVLMDEIASFVDAVRRGVAPAVTGEDGKRALALAIEISHRINRYRAIQARAHGTS